MRWDGLVQTERQEYLVQGPLSPFCLTDWMVLHIREGARLHQVRQSNASLTQKHLCGHIQK